MSPKTEKSVRGSNKNQQNKTGPQIYGEEIKNLRFINVEAEHQFLLKLQEDDLDTTEKWIKKYPGGIDFQK